MNWFSLDIMREMSIKMYYKVVPTGQELDTLNFMMGSWGAAQGSVGLVVLGLIVIPNCNSLVEGVNCVSGDQTPKELLIMLSAMAATFTCFIAMMIFTKKAEQLGFLPAPMAGWGVTMLALTILSILAATDAPAIKHNADGTEGSQLLFIIICAVMAVGTVFKGFMVPVTSPRDAAAAHAAGGADA